MFKEPIFKVWALTRGYYPDLKRYCFHICFGGEKLLTTAGTLDYKLNKLTDACCL